VRGAGPLVTLASTSASGGRAQAGRRRITSRNDARMKGLR